MQTIISAITAAIAIATLVIAWYTYKSQKRTQENTRILVGSKEALITYLEFTFFSMLKIELFLLTSKRIMRKSNYKAKLNGSLLADLRFDLSPLNNNLFYENTQLFYDLNFLKTYLTTINNLCAALLEEQYKTTLTKNELDCYFKSIYTNLKKAYIIWYQFTYNYSPIISDRKNQKLSDMDFDNLLTIYTDEKILSCLGLYLRELKSDVKSKSPKNILNGEDFIILDLIEDEELKHKAENILKTIFGIHYNSVINYINLDY